VAYSIAKIGGREIKLELTDKTRSSAFWQLLVKPAAYSAAALKAAFAGAAGVLTGASSPIYKQTTLAPESLTPEQQEIWDRVKAEEWYHTIDLGNGLTTPGQFNHAPLLKHYRLPERLDGLRALDVATMDGFFAFEMEKRGAASVTALDVDTIGELDFPPLRRRKLAPGGVERSAQRSFLSGPADSEVASRAAADERL